MERGYHAWCLASVRADDLARQKAGRCMGNRIVGVDDVKAELARDLNDLVRQRQQVLRLAHDEPLGEIDAGEYAELRVTALNKRHEARRGQARLHRASGWRTKLARVARERAPFRVVVFGHVDDK